ncbi:sterile alpha motif domain-containing protein 3 [Alligator sinensis]|uniref:Sterile alpha motif domain-containing protein 3 n=1 Tax=Alligator sinensis TaxID=38654 RepID=A0A3Q0H2Y1_ALLSI|nr:sterile alpha motif domain-containing protein 3 [Alligator sinensis]
MESWSVDQVCNWLIQRNLGELVPKFREEEVSGAALLALNDRMVQQLVKKIGHQAVLMDLISKYHQRNHELESLTYSCDTAPPTSPEAISGMPASISISEAPASRMEQGRAVKSIVSGAPVSFAAEAGRTNDVQVFNPFGPTEKTLYFSPAENKEGLIDQRVLKHKKNMKPVFARYKTLQWTNSYILPGFPYDVKCILAERKCPDHSMRIRIIEFLQADMTKYLEGSLYPNSQQYNIVVNALLQAYPFLDEDGNGFLLWKRALKDRFKYVRRPIEDDEQVLRNKCKFGHRRGQTRKSAAAESRCDEIQVVQIKEEPACFEGSEMNEHINWFKQEYVKTERNWEEVDNRMNMTLGIRRKMINNKAPLKEILRLFPFLRCPYQLFREFHLLTHMDIYKKTVEILEMYSENILSLYSVRNNPINVMLQENLKQHTEEDILKYMKMTATCLLLPDAFGDDTSLFVAVNEEVKVSTPVLEVKNPFNVNTCEFALYVEKEKLAQLDDCTMALAALLAAFHVFDIQCPEKIHNTLNFLESLIFEVRCLQSFPVKVKRELEELECLTV